jgi:hypothetical protein
MIKPRFKPRQKVFIELEGKPIESEVSWVYWSIDSVDYDLMGVTFSMQQHCPCFSEDQFDHAPIFATKEECLNYIKSQ